MPADADLEPIIGLVPAAGHATRLGDLSGSKELLPVRTGEGGPLICEHLLGAMEQAGIPRALFVLRAEKRDIPERLGGAHGRMALGYLEVPPTRSIVHTLDAAFAELGGRRVAMGFPDVLFSPRNAFASLIERQRERRADAVLGLFPTGRPDKADMVEVDAAGRVMRIEIKPAWTTLEHTWLIAVWSPVFFGYLHAWLRRPWRREREPYPGDVFQAAVDAGLRIEAVVFPGGFHLDVGTPDDLGRAGAMWERIR